jgi:hypothetical protein
MIREMLRISLLLAGATVGLSVGDRPAAAQTSPQPRTRIEVPLMVPDHGPSATLPAQRLDRTQSRVRAQSCASMSGAAAERCYSDLRTKIEADKLRQGATEPSLPERK